MLKKNSTTIKINASVSLNYYCYADFYNFLRDFTVHAICMIFYDRNQIFYEFQLHVLYKKKTRRL